MTELTLEVHYQVQGQDHSVNLVTLATDPSSASSSSSTTGASGLPGATSVP